jgi:FtsH-binding integral membrane protein
MDTTEEERQPLFANLFGGAASGSEKSRGEREPVAGTSQTQKTRSKIDSALTHSPLTLVSADVESGLYPGITPLDNALRLGFIQKVFGIVAFQLALTAAVATAINASHAAQSLLVANPWIYFLLSMTSILGLIPLFLLKDRHPHNLIALSMWTCTFGVSVGMTVSFYSAVVVAQAVFLTACMVVGLTAYAFHATRKGVEFGWMRPLLLSSLLGLIVSGFLLMFFHSPIAETIYSCRYWPRPADRRFTRSLAHWPTRSLAHSLTRSFANSPGSDPLLGVHRLRRPPPGGQVRRRRIHLGERLALPRRPEPLPPHTPPHERRTKTQLVSSSTRQRRVL